MTRTMCVLTIQKQLSEKEGVTSANVNFALGCAILTCDAKRIVLPEGPPRYGDRRVLSQ